MAGSGGDAPPPPLSGGEFLLQLLQKPPHIPTTTPRPQPSPPPSSQSLPHDPAVAAVGPTLPSPPFQSNGHDYPYRPPWSHTPPHFAPHNFFVQSFTQKPNPNPNWSSPSQPPPGFNHSGDPTIQYNPNSLSDDLRKLRFLNTNQQDHNIMFGSLPCEIRKNEVVPNGNSSDNLARGSRVEGLKEREMGLGNRRLNGLEVDDSLEFNRNPQVNSRFRNFEQGQGGRGGVGIGTQQHGGNYRSVVGPKVRRPPPGFPSNPGSVGDRGSSSEHDLDKRKRNIGQLNHRGVVSSDEEECGRVLYRDMPAGRGLTHQLDSPGLPAGSNLHLVSTSDIEESVHELDDEDGEDGGKSGNCVRDQMRRGGGRGQIELDEQLLGTLVPEDGSDGKKDKRKHHNSRDKDYRTDRRGQWLLGQRMRNIKSQIECRNDIKRLNAPFLAIYESLIPPEEEKAKQKQLLALLEKHVTKEWPEARLYLYGSCANSFGFTKSDIDVYLAIEDADVNKSEVLLKLADILQLENLQNVQALTRARVPIVKLMDPATGISCDICVNNMLAVVNTKLLRDYAHIDERLRQLAFIVKHWAKSRGVNETYQGTLSSYAYVLMSIHFLQRRRPAILPCLQGMESTYAVTVDTVECAYFDQVEKLCGFGSRNGESIAQLVWAFFNYWAYCHDYANDVISVRTGSILSKRAKDWTRRIGNDRHLICIEDPFEVSHDLGRVVDKHSIRVLREEFERAAEIMQYDHDPCSMLFEPYVLS